jgi:hypothetical protein
VSPSDPGLLGQDESDSLYTIQASVTLLNFAGSLGEAGVELSWGSDPGVGPEGLAGYRLYRLGPGEAGNGTRIGPELITESRYRDASGVPGGTYRLTAVNGLQEELELGRLGMAAPIAGLKLWPSPVAAGGALAVAFAVPTVGGREATDLDVGLYDVSGRRVATLARGPVEAEAGVATVVWEVRGAGGRSGLAPGVYFVRAVAPSAGFRAERKVVVIP